MARPTNTTTSNEREWKEVTNGVLIRVSGNPEYFSINWYGAVIHGCSVRHGQNGDFISWPAFKNADGKYTKRAYVWAEKGSDDENTLNRIVAMLKK